MMHIAQLQIFYFFIYSPAFLFFAFAGQQNDLLTENESSSSLTLSTFSPKLHNKFDVFSTQINTKISSIWLISNNNQLKQLKCCCCFYSFVSLLLLLFQIFTFIILVNHFLLPTVSEKGKKRSICLVSRDNCKLRRKH